MTATDLEILERAAAYANRHGDIDPHERMERAERFVNRTRIASDFFGIESVECADESLLYLNAGDTYDVTLLVVESDGAEIEVGSWGDWVETTESEHKAETDTVRCGYCSAFTPLCEEALRQPDGARDAWRKTICEQCGHYVDGSGKGNSGETMCYATFNRFEIAMTKGQSSDGYHSGQCDDDVARLVQVPDIAAQLNAIDPQLIREELREYGAWDDAELSDDAANRLRIVWLAAGNIYDD